MTNQITQIESPPARMNFEEVSVAYGSKTILNGSTFQVPHGARLAVVGPNGAGKSTLFKAMVGLLPLQSGRIFIHGNPSARMWIASLMSRSERKWIGNFRSPSATWS